MLYISLERIKLLYFCLQGHDTPNIDADTFKMEIILDYNSTKGRVDKICAMYSFSNITRRLSCADFYSLLNIFRINAQILYMLPQPANNPPSWGLFLNNLALGLVKEYFRAQAKITSLPNGIKTYIMISQLSAKYD